MPYHVNLIPYVMKFEPTEREQNKNKKLRK